MKWKYGSLAVIVAAAAGTVASAVPAQALDPVRVAAGHRGNWDSLITLHCIEQGICEEAGLDVDITWTRGGSETLQAVITDSVDFALTNGAMGVLAAYARGAPIRIVSAEMTGIADMFWYARADSGIESMEDAGGKTMGFSRPGSSTNLAALAIADIYGVDVEAVPTGGISDTRTQVMSGQVDLGWSVPPFNLDLVDKGEITIVVRGGDVAELGNQTVRVNVVNANFLAEHPDVVKRFIQAYSDTIDWMYDNLDESVARYAEINEITEDVARASLEFFPKEGLDPARLVGLDTTVQQAMDMGELDEPLTEEQLDELVDLQTE
jgi:NitT/TauT family transport system substrate-binding protein